VPSYNATMLQANLAEWLIEALGKETLMSPQDRAIRVLEEAIELAQAVGIPESKAAELLRYVYARPVGEPTQEIAGVINAALLTAHGLGFNGLMLAENELHRARRDIDLIRHKNLSKVQA